MRRRGRSTATSPRPGPTFGSSPSPSNRAGSLRRGAPAVPIGRGSHQAGTHAPGRGRGARGEAELAEDVGKVPVDSVLAQYQALGDAGLLRPCATSLSTSSSRGVSTAPAAPNPTATCLIPGTSAGGV